jgi:hypothetical protein
MELGVFETPSQEWDEFVSRYTDLVFYQSFWSEVLKRGLGGHPLYFYLREGGRIVAGLPAVLFNFKIFRILYASIPYGGLIGDRSTFPPFSSLLDAEFRKRRFDQVRVADSPFLEPYQPSSFKSLSATCNVLDLRGRSKESLWDGYKKYVRRDIRRAQRSEIVIRHGTSRGDVKRFYELYLSSMERNKAMAKYPFRWFEALYDVVAGRSLGIFLIAEVNQIAIAGVVLIYSSTSTHYLHNGSHSDFLKLCPNELLIHYCLEEAIGKNHSYFDFMGSASNDLSLIRFKEKWGSKSLDIHTYIKNYHPVKANLWEWGKKVMSSELGSKVVRGIRG